MYQYCPGCKELIQEGDVCPHCQTVLVEKIEGRKPLTRKEKALYLAGYLVLFISVFLGRDLTNRQDVTNGLIIYGVIIVFSGFWFIIREWGGVGYPPIWGYGE